MSSLDLIPKPFFIWTFNENMGNWANDASNWNQRWKLNDGVICLENTLVEPQIGLNELPWFPTKSKKEDKVSKSSKKPLWSAPIPETTGMRCITLDYSIQVDSEEMENYSLAVLQQQDG
ncbi:unnamed protein product [Hymenolepis diminuta]|uniref:MAM domain-containing protein n=1 Tax=Hymenolepis diminuta TaxID=6216 RepID=A0A564Z227_HYMDI|nr:unnamed protein product [Hymenolepis diminuta]